MDENVRHLIEESGLVIPSARQHALPLPLRRLHRRILRHFADQAGAPTTLLLHQWAHDLDVCLETALARLVAVDLVEADPPSGRLFGAYPFSATPRGHTVQIDGGPTVQAYCAIDALGIPSMLGRGVGISSRDPHTGESIRVTVTDGQATWQPRDTVVVVGTDNGGREQSACCCRCPYITFHASAATARAHLQISGLTGRVLSQPQATDVAALLFGGLIHLSAKDAGRNIRERRPRRGA